MQYIDDVLRKGDEYSMSQEIPTKAIAKIGLILGQSKRRGRTYVTIPIDAAQAVHDFLVKERNKRYIEEYRKL